jgi:hypothetical protein
MILRIKLCIGLVLLLGLLSNGLKAQTIQNDKPQIILHQLRLADGKTPVEIQKPQANFRTPNSVGGIVFVIKNNSNKNIIALSLVYSIKLERNKVTSKDTVYHTVDTFVHKDMFEGNFLKPVLPGREEILAESAETVYENDTLVKGIEAKIDYIEFDDGTSLGPNRKGKELVLLLRNGASKYKNWLVRQYNQNKRSLDFVTSLLRAGDFPIDVGLTSNQERLGAQIYLRFIKRVHENQGARSLADLINR